MPVTTPNLNTIKSGLSDLPGTVSVIFTDPTSNTIEIRINDFNGILSNMSSFNSKINMLVPGYTFIKGYRIDRYELLVTLSRTP